MIEPVFLESPHRRWNALKREWVVVSSAPDAAAVAGADRGDGEAGGAAVRSGVLPVPWETRARAGHETPQYTGTYVFENDFAALKPDVAKAKMDVAVGRGLLRAETESGVCRVLCFDPRHDLTLATMEPAAIRRVVEMWAEQAAELGARREMQYVQIFENRGAMMGASNPHPHGQIWATEHVPNEPAL